MKIVNTFISDKEQIPEYTLLCLRQLRNLNPDTDIYFITSNISPYEKFFDNNNIQFIDQSTVSSDALKEFNEVSWLKKWGRPETTYKSPNYFFHRAMERIYYLQAFIQGEGLKDVFHCENDVVCYYPLSSIVDDCDKPFMITPATGMASTMAVCYIKGSIPINNICLQLNDFLKKGEEELLRLYDMDMVNEMTLLNLCSKMHLASHFPILPSTKESKFLYDPSSYGQFLGGTNNSHGDGFTDDNHILGKYLSTRALSICFKDGKPYVTQKNNGNNLYPLYNLHIHSKDLARFINV